MSDQGKVIIAINGRFTGTEITKYGTKMWFENGYLHRIDGPAVIYCSEKSPEWAIKGEFIHSYKRFQELTRCDNSVIILLRLKYGNIKDNIKGKV